MSTAAARIRASAGPVEIIPVTSKAEREAFIRLPWLVYRDDPCWVPPLLMERREFLDREKNPFFEFGEVELFLARRGDDVVGRIAAVEDCNHNAFHGSRWGGFGLFESIDDTEVAEALFEAAAEWCAGRGLERLWGPVSFSTNYECGLLVEGFEDPPAISMGYNPRYYERLFLAAGLARTKDLWAWELSPHAPIPEKVSRIAEKVREREGLTVRPVRLERLDEELAVIQSVYNEAWEDNWGFVPMTPAELEKTGSDLKRIAIADFILIAEVEGVPVAFSLTLPDFNQALRRVNGRLFPTGFMRLLWHARKIDRARLMALGIKADYRKRGIDAVLYKDTILAVRRLGYRAGEIGWTLEDNDLVNRAIASMGGRRYKTYRMYERSLDT